jgi:carboxymethylenebutenolidase
MYPEEQKWKHTVWWRRGRAPYKEAQLFVQIARGYPVLSIGVKYGVPPTEPNDRQQIGAACLGNFGADEHGITVADVEAFKKAMTNAQRAFEVKIYPGAGHGFENPNNKDGYRPEAAADAWMRTINFFKSTLK